MSPIADALSSASLLLAAIALVYSAWSASIDEEATRSYSGHAKTKADEQSQTRRILNGRARPVMIACWLILVTFLPRSYAIAKDTVICASELGDRCSYDDVAAIFLLTQLVVAGLALHLSGQVSQLKKQLRS